MADKASAANTKQTFRWLFRQAKKSRGWIFLSIGFGLGGGLLIIGQAWLLAEIVHRALIEKHSLSSLHPLFGIAIAILLLRAAFAWLREIAGFKAGAAIRQTLRMHILTHVMELGPRFLDDRRTGTIAAALMEQVESVHDFFALYLPQLALALLIPFAIIIAVIPISWAVVVIFMVTAPLIPIFMVLIGMGAESISQRHYQSLARLGAYFLDVLQGLPTLKLLGCSRAEVNNLAAASKTYRQRTMGVLRVAFLSSAVLEFLCSVAIALVAVYLGMRYLGYIHFGNYGELLTLKSGLFILLLAPEFYLPLRELGAHYHARAEAVGAADSLLDILATPTSDESIANKPSKIPHPKQVGIVCQDLHFAYDEGRRLGLEGVSFQLTAGEHVALVGPSGAGKTTLINLLIGFLRCDKGRIEINGISLDRIPPKAWRHNLAWVGQFPMLFHGTIRENILMGRPHANDTKVRRAAHAAHVIEFADKMAKGLDSPVGEGGNLLSRGQAQRVVLARAFLKDAPFLILDEPTASLDHDSEKLVLDALESLAADKTLFIVAHRLRTILFADRIIVLSDGRITETGSYQSLSTGGGYFQSMLAVNRYGENR